LGLQKTSYSFGYGSLWSLAGLLLCLAGVVRLRLVFGGWIFKSWCESAIVILNIRGGVILTIKYPPWD
jgi:hypothetical protein